jgi:hypothetical protein
MVEKDEEISPASIPFKNSISWSNTIKANSTHIENDGSTIVFDDELGFRFCRSEEEFTSGSYRFEIEIDYQTGTNQQVSFGICNNSVLACDSNVYYFTGAYIYCSSYPSFTKDYTNIHKEVPIVVKDKGKIAINFDLDTKKLFWELNGMVYDEIDIESTTNDPFYLVIGMFKGKAVLI